LHPACFILDGHSITTGGRMNIADQAAARASGVAIIAAMGLVVAGSASASPAHPASGTGPDGRVASLTFGGFLDGVAATSSRNAWAVGGTNTDALILHWSGRAWKRVRIPAIAGFLEGVAATSASNAWAVGVASVGPLILHWDGRAWKRVHIRVIGGLSGVSATSASNAWAVGAVVLHWSGRAWHRVHIPVSMGLYDVAATSASNAWAVGTKLGGVVLHWNGKAWKRVPSPARVNSTLLGVAAISARNAWAAGFCCFTTRRNDQRPAGTLIFRWNGKAWNRVPSPAPAGSFLNSVAATSASNAWAVGLDFAGVLILHWNGRSWRQLPSPSAGAAPYDDLSAVAVVSADDAWAVGETNSSVSGPETLILHWNGKDWN
jgi:hypothetical protein